MMIGANTANSKASTRDGGLTEALSRIEATNRPSDRIG